MPSPDITVRISHKGAVAVIAIDNPPVNALSQNVRASLLGAIQILGADHEVKAVVISGGAGRFIGGADLHEMDAPVDEPVLPTVVEAINNLNVPVIAAIDGAALGGGLEIALACDLRLGSVKAILGLTETRLGIIPGAGGTQRLPRLVGVANAISIICEGRILSAREAMEAGVLDGLIEGDVLAAAIAQAQYVKKRSLSRMPLPNRDVAAEETASAKALTRARGVPAIKEAIRIIRASGDSHFSRDLVREREAFLKLRDSEEARALRYVFMAERAAWKIPLLEGARALSVKRIAVIGAGTMGAGIAVTFATANLPVTLVERDDASVVAGWRRVHEIFEKNIKRGRMDSISAATYLKQIVVTDEWSQIANIDFVIEAAFEDLATKRKIFQRLSMLASPGTILASNTSYLDLDQLAAVTSRPQDVIGMHFFAPANIMKLVEIVRGKNTSKEAIATALSLVRTLGKQPIVAGNCDGFIGNRIYAIYRRHAEYLVEDGLAPEDIDTAMEAYGFAMGIFAASDLSGLDIAYAMRQRRKATRDQNERYTAIADKLYEFGRLGRKTGAGWYSYASDGKKKSDTFVADLVAEERKRKGVTLKPYDSAQIQRRLLSVMANEGAKILAEGIALRSSDIDVAFVNGYGFPRVKGGPMWAADRMGLISVLQEVEEAYKAGGAGSEPSSLLIQLARSGESLARWSNVSG